MTMPVNNISRNKPVKIARTIECDLGPLNTVEDKVAAHQGLALAEKKKFIQAEALEETKIHPLVSSFVATYEIGRAHV